MMKKDKKKSLFYFLLTSHLFLKHRFFFVFQLTDALTFLHVSCRYVHRNVCPNSVYVTKSGSWKLGSLEFMGEWRIQICMCINFRHFKKELFFPKWSRKTWAKSLVFSLHSVIYFKFYMLKFCLLICLVFLLVFLLCIKMIAN